MARKILNILSLMVMLLITSFNSVGITAFAETSTYSNVLSDLKIDSSFNEEDYLVIEDNYTLQVIQIAETIGGELLIYVYQPSGQKADLRATSINISTGINDNSKWVNYDLKFLNSSGVFYKYKVEDFEVKKDVVRYYDISSIFRKWNRNYDKDTGNDNTIQEISFEVARLFTACTIDNKVTYTCNYTETIEITGKYVGFIRYKGSNIFYNSACDCHYVAFSTDREIDKLLEADVEYVYRSFQTPYYYGVKKDTQYGSYKNGSKTVYEDDNVNGSLGWWIGKTEYSFSRIQSINEFTKSENLDNIDSSYLDGKQWVLRFVETEFRPLQSSLTPMNYEEGTQVSEVTIMRLKFEMDGVIYNLGVVDNKQTGSMTPSNGQEDIWDKIKEILFYIMCALLGVIIAIMLISFMPVILPFVLAVLGFIGNILLMIFKGIIWFITFPFKKE